MCKMAGFPAVLLLASVPLSAGWGMQGPPAVVHSNAPSPTGAAALQTPSELLVQARRCTCTCAGCLTRCSCHPHAVLPALALCFLLLPCASCSPAAPSADQTQGVQVP